MKFRHDYETSTAFCSCGETNTWAGFSEAHMEWVKVHSQHDTSKDEEWTSEDGKRAYAEK